MKKHIITIISALAFITIGCQKAVLEPETEISQIRVTAALPAMTRVSMNDNGNTTKTFWEEGDVICLVFDNEVYYYSVVSTDGSKATFEPSNEYNVLRAKEGDSIQAYYGCSRGRGQWTSYSTATPLYAAGKITGSELSLKFDHMLAYIRFNLTKEAFPESESKSLYAVTLTSDGPIFTDSYIVDTLSVTMKPADAEESSSYHTDFAAVDLNQETWESEYIPALPYQDCQISIYVNNYIFTLRNTPKGGFLPGKVYTLSPDSEDFFISANLEQSEFNVGFEEGVINAALETNSDLEVEIEILDDAKEWIEVIQTKADRNYSYTVSYKKNTAPATREGHIVFSVMHSHEFMGKKSLACDTLTISQAPLYGKRTIHVGMSGELKKVVSEEEKNDITDLKITGIIDHTEDLGYLNSFNSLVRLDLSEVYIVSMTEQLTSFYSTIPDGAFRYSESTGTLKTLITPESLIKLGNKALQFYELDSLVFHNEIQEIGQENRLGKKTFISNGNLKYVSKFNSNVEELYITDLRAYCETGFGAEDIYDTCYGGGFQPKRIYLNNELITELVIPAYISQIRNNAFQNVGSITSVTFADETTYVGPWAFKDCRNLKEIKNYNSLSAIGKGAFAGTAISEFKVPESMTELNGDIFNNCTNLSKVIFNDSINTIGCMAFYNCTSLQSIEIPKSVTTINAGAFRKCTNLKSVGNLDNVKFLYQYAFMDCSSLESVSFKNLEDMGAGAFNGCDNLKKVYINDLRLWCQMTWCHLITSNHNGWWSNWDNDWDKTSPLYYAEEMYINDVLTTDLVIPEDVETIGNRAFCGFEALTSIDLKNVYQIGSSFNGCINLKEVKTSRSEPAGLPSYDAFDSRIRNSCVLKVPAGSLETYKNSIWASYFTNIEEY